MKRKENGDKPMKSKQQLKKTGNILFYGIVTLLSIIALACLIVIIGYVMIKGISHISWEFLTQEPKMMGKEGGIFSTIIGTIYVTGLAILISAPIGIAAAIYFNEYAKEGRVISIIRMFTEILAGIPSIVFGLFGFSFFVVFLGMGWSVLSGALSLSLMILPTLIRSTEESLKTVPMTYREGSLSLGATKWKTTVKVVLPCCSKGILSGMILGIGRAIGETAVILLTVGGALKLPMSIFDSTRTMAVHMYIMASEGISESKAYATAALLIIIVLVINAIANIVTSRMGGISR